MARAKPTYKGIQMASKAEVSFAILLDKLGSDWEYEPTKIEIVGKQKVVTKTFQPWRYTPDFLVKTNDKDLMFFICFKKYCISAYDSWMYFDVKGPSWGYKRHDEAKFSIIQKTLLRYHDTLINKVTDKEINAMAAKARELGYGKV